MPDTLKGYKALDKNHICGNFQYRVGQIYEQEPTDPIGFTFCTSFNHIFDYHPKDKKKTIIVEVLVLGNVTPIGDNRFWKETDTIEIVRELTYDEISEIEQLSKMFGDYIIKTSRKDLQTACSNAEIMTENICNLADRERHILAMRAGIITGKSMSNAEIGRVLGVTRERARVLERRALNQLGFGKGEKRIYVSKETRNKLYKK